MQPLIMLREWYFNAAVTVPHLNAVKGFLEFIVKIIVLICKTEAKDYAVSFDFLPKIPRLFDLLRPFLDLMLLSSSAYFGL